MGTSTANARRCEKLQCKTGWMRAPLRCQRISELPLKRCWAQWVQYARSQQSDHLAKTVCGHSNSQVTRSHHWEWKPPGSKERPQGLTDSAGRVQNLPPRLAHRSEAARQCSASGLSRALAMVREATRA